MLFQFKDPGETDGRKYCFKLQARMSYPLQLSPSFPFPPPPTSLFSLFPLLSLPSSLFFLPLLFLFSFVCVVLMHDSWNVCMHVCIYVHVDLQQKHTCTHVCTVHVYTYAVHVAFSTYLYMCIR